MLRLLLLLMLAFTSPAWAQESDDAEGNSTETDTAEVEEETDAEAVEDDDDLYAEQEEDDFESSEKASFEQTLVFPTDI